MIKFPSFCVSGGAGILMALFLVKKRILSSMTAVACSNRTGFNGEIQSGSNLFTVVGSRTLPETIWPPISAAFSNRTTRKFSFLASFANCFRRMAALSPAGPECESVKMHLIWFEEEITDRHRQCRHRLDRFRGLVAEDLMNSQQRLQVSYRRMWKTRGC